MHERSSGTDAGLVSRDDYQQLQHSYDALHEQFTAADEVLSALARSAGDPDTVLATIVESARRLCRADAAHLYVLEGGFYRPIRAVGISDEALRVITEHPMPVNRDTLIGRVGLERSTQQIADVLADPDYGRFDIQRVGGFRTTMGAPMLVDDEVVGALSLWRNDVAPFDQREMAIVSAFAGQAAMAVTAVRLVQQLEARRAELAQKVEQLEALREVGEAVSSSLDPADVLATIVMHAVKLSGTDGGSIMEYSERDRSFRVRSVHRTDPEVVERLRSVRIDLDETLVGRAARQRQPIAVADLGAVELDPHLRVLHDAGWRSVLAVPLLREDRIVGSLVVRRKRPGGFTAETVELLETFASQSALALLNAQLYRELQQQSAELELASRHKSEFLASMSHELRTPLNAVLGFSEVLLERLFGDINERQEEYLRDIHGSGKHLLELLNEILDLSKVEAGRMELEPTTFPLRPLLDGCAAMLRERAAAHAITVDVSVDDDVDLVHADELRLKQVVLNLMSNAVKFTEDGGSVRLEARCRPGAVEIIVSDTGVGIPEADRERIFESFQQGGRGSSHEEGTGLGLTLSRRLVELLGGHLWLESEVGVGSTFGVVIPDGLPRQEAADEAGAGVGHRARVLVVEDDRPSIDLLSAFLAGEPLDVTVARDGVSGLEAVRRTSPAAVLLDIRLPGLDGWTVLHELKADPTTREIPVIVVSMLDERSRGLSAGAVEYLVKPVTRESVLAALASVGVPGPRADSPTGEEVTA